MTEQSMHEASLEFFNPDDTLRALAVLDDVWREGTAGGNLDSVLYTGVKKRLEFLAEQRSSGASNLQAIRIWKWIEVRRARKNPVPNSAAREQALDLREAAIEQRELRQRTSGEDNTTTRDRQSHGSAKGGSLEGSMSRRPTPLSGLDVWANKTRLGWSNDDFDLIKGYILCCLSELAYLALVPAELVGCDRYKIFEPSLANESMRRAGMMIDIVAILRQRDIRAEIINIGSYVYLVARFTMFTVVAVRGTNSPRDFIMDINAFKSPAEHGSYHRGFADEAAKATDLLLDVVGADLPLYFTGHSLGAAVAAILAQTWPRRADVRTPYLFACPRFGTRAAASGVIRYTFARPLDFVPHAPPRFLGFSDTGMANMILPAGTKRAGGLRSVWNTVRRLSIDQHRVDGIRAMLGAAVGETFEETAYIDLLTDALVHHDDHVA